MLTSAKVSSILQRVKRGEPCEHRDADRARPLHRGRDASRWRESTRDHQPRHRRARRPRDERDGRGRGPRGACRTRRTARVGEARLRRARQGHPRVRGGVRGARRRADPDPRRRAGQDDPRGQDRAAQGRRHARALRRAVAPGARDQRPQHRPRRRRPRAAPPARRRRRDRAVELPDHAAVQQARPGVAGGQHGRGQAGRHDAADDAAAGRDLRRGRAAGRRLQRAARPRPRRRRRARPPPARAQGRLHRLARRSASRSRRSPRPGPSA